MRSDVGRAFRRLAVVAGAAFAALAVSANAFAAAGPANWTAAWATAQTPPIPASRVIAAPQTLKGTVRYRLRLGAGGDKLTLRLSNEVSAEPLVVDRVTVAAENASRATTVLFGGAASAEAPAGAPLLSDPVDLKVAAGERIVVSLYLARGYVATQSQSANKAEYFAEVDRTEELSATGGVPVSVRPIVSAVLVSGPAARRAIVAFGDSITDGAGGREPLVRGWPDVLSNRLNTARRRTGFSVVNAGISGNRLFATTSWGLAALARFDRDVLALPNVGYVIVLEGVNDIGGLGDAPGAPQTTAERMIASYRQIITRARQHGIKVVGGTLLPFAGAHYHSAAREGVRQQVNTWIRTSGAFDGVIDFDAAVRDPAQPDRLLAAYDSGDHLHPSDAGYRAMGEAIDLSLFR